MEIETFIPHFKNLSLINIVEDIGGIVYTEEWKDVEGYEGVYQVSNFGRVKSLERIVLSQQGGEKHFGCFILSQTLIKAGYTKVALYKNNAYVTRTLHRLVAIAFIENPENKPEVNHIFGIKYDNRAVKLEWNTSSENSQHKFDMKLQRPAWLGKKGKQHPTSKAVNQYDKNMNFIKRWDSPSEATESLGFGRRCSLISACCLQSIRIIKGREYKTKYAYGFIWRYV